MPDDVQDTSADQSGTQSSQTDGSQAAPTGDTPPAYLGTYSTREEAEKGLAEKEQFANRMKTERDEARAKAGEIDVLKSLVEKMSNPAPSAPARRDQSEILSSWKERLEEEGAPAIVDLLASVEADKEAAWKEMLAERDKSAEQQLAELKAMIAGQDPEYLAHKDKVAELAEELGLDAIKDRSTLIKFAKKLGPEQPPAPERAGGMGTPVVATPDSAPGLTDETLAFLQSSQLTADLTDDEKVALADKVKANTEARKARG